MMKRTKRIWGWLYDISNKRVFDKITRDLRGALDIRNLNKLIKLLKNKKPDAIVATHFLLPSIAGILKKMPSMRNMRIYTVVTDYGPHTYWLSDNVDVYFVGSERVKEEFIKRGVSASKIEVTGIPTVKEFSIGYDKEKLAVKYGLDPDKKTVFIMSGGFGVGPIGKILMSLNECRSEIQAVVVCGYNKVIYERLKEMTKDLKYRLVPFGFTDKVAELMSASDIMITKAGGISVTEALNMSLPMILFESVPGQETWNEDFLVKEGAAEKALSVHEIPSMVDRINLSEDARQRLLENIERIKKADASRQIAKHVINDLMRMESGGAPDKGRHNG